MFKKKGGIFFCSSMALISSHKALVYMHDENISEEKIITAVSQWKTITLISCALLLDINMS